jgi:hypothetical protein
MPAALALESHVAPSAPWPGGVTSSSATCAVAHWAADGAPATSSSAEQRDRVRERERRQRDGVDPEHGRQPAQGGPAPLARAVEGRAGHCAAREQRQQHAARGVAAALGGEGDHGDVDDPQGGVAEHRRGDERPHAADAQRPEPAHRRAVGRRDGHREPREAQPEHEREGGGGEQRRRRARERDRAGRQQRAGHEHADLRRGLERVGRRELRAADAQQAHPLQSHRRHQPGRARRGQDRPVRPEPPHPEPRQSSSPSSS